MYYYHCTIEGPSNTMTTSVYNMIVTSDDPEDAIGITSILTARLHRNITLLKFELQQTPFFNPAIDYPGLKVYHCPQ